MNPVNVTDIDLQTLEMMGGAVNSGKPDTAQPGRTLVSLRDAHIGWFNDFSRRAHAAQAPAEPTPSDPSATSAPFHRTFIAKPIESWTELVNGPCRVSVAVLDGNQVFIGYSKNRGEYIEGQAGGANGAYEVHVPAGSWWVSVRMGDTMQPKDAEVSGFPE